MEFFPGMTLTTFLETRRLAPAEAVAIVATVARALAECHSRGIVHRDITLNNILVPQVSPGSPLTNAFFDAIKLIDFGLAVRLTQDHYLTTTDACFGTPHFLPPEMLATKAAHAHVDLGAMEASENVGQVLKRAKRSPRGDVYQLGIVLYKLITDTFPFTGPNLQTIFKNILGEPAPLLADAMPQVPSDLSYICSKCLQKDSRARYASALELTEDIASYIDGEPLRDYRRSTLPYVVDLLAKGLGNSKALIFLALASGILSFVFHFLRAGWPAMLSRVDLAARLPNSVRFPALLGQPLSQVGYFFVIIGGYLLISLAGYLVARFVKPATLRAAVRSGMVVGFTNAFFLSFFGAWFLAVHAALPEVSRDLDWLSRAAGTEGSYAVMQEELLQSHPDLDSVPPSERGSIVSTAVGSGFVVWSFVGISVGLLWAVVVGFSLQVPGTVHGMLLLRAERPGLRTVVRYLEVYWPVTLLIARAADTIFFAPFFVGLFSIKWIMYLSVSAVGCGWLLAFYLYVKRSSWAKRHWSVRLCWFLVTMLVYYGVHWFARNTVYVPARLRLLP